MSSGVIALVESGADYLDDIRRKLDVILYAVRERSEDMACLQKRVQEIAEEMAAAKEFCDSTDARLDRMRDDLLEVKHELAEQDKELRNRITSAVASIEDRLREKSDSKSLALYISISGIIFGAVGLVLGALFG